MIIGKIKTLVGEVDQVSTVLDTRDILGAIGVRWNIRRDKFRIVPGLYAVGVPDSSSDIFVTANYKLSFDHLRKNLDGLNAWILVLDTKGINVWCAAGKGTFGTAELVNRINITGIDKIVNHRRLIVPQLGATGVSAHQVKALTVPKSISSVVIPNAGFIPTNLTLKPNHGFIVVFGPIRASDIKAFIANGYKATHEMRRVTFTMYERLKLAPVDIVYAGKRLFIALLVILVLSGLNTTGISQSQILEKGLPAIIYILMAYLAGILVTPVLLPYIPVRMFGFKGMITGLVLAIVLSGLHLLGSSIIETVSWYLLIMAIASFMAMNFTGSSTYTSLSGVKKEMRVLVPIQISFASIGLILFIISNF